LRGNYKRDSIILSLFSVSQKYFSTYNTELRDFEEAILRIIHNIFKTIVDYS